MPNNDKTYWIVVADGAKCRVLTRKGTDGTLSAASNLCFSDSEARELTREIGTDRPGRSQESVGGARHAMEPRVDWHRFAKEQFAHQVAQALEDAALKKKYQALIVVAPPRTLGDLRGAIGKHTRALVVGEIAKDLTNIADHDLPAHLA